ncbi:transmembrane protein 176 isoform X1 [Myxocyprinus asiaticus]|uniref:transmembrane protein 176 isoform X1 n=1 Tax=Myxocyprinus asiaticus TaxID=70543 RepID=UPI0022234746|nr:transmembrane protein 176 isoform X1 [Myxocyprinus asiaticus]
MTLTVSTDLSVTTAPGREEEKLEDKKKALRKSFEKGDPKTFGVSQVVIGLLIISYSLPLLSAETTMIIKFSVPWWSGLMFVISGAVAIAVEKKASTKTLSVCLAVSVVAIIISVIALVLYYIDIAHQMTIKCDDELNQLCIHQYYATRFSKGVKIIISMIILVQTGMSCAFTFMLYNHRKNFTGYLTVNE